jgi:hypothetical protein
MRENARDYYIVPAMALVFAAAYCLALVNRNRPTIHGFYMICTTLALINPIFQRLYAHYLGIVDESHQELINFVIIDLIMLGVIAFCGGWGGIRRAAVIMLAVCVAVEWPLFTIATTESWVHAMTWFRNIG